MSLFGGFFGGLNDDSFISGHMRNMNRMMESFDMLTGFPGMAPMPFAFGNANALMNNFNNGMGMAMSLPGGNCHSYSHSTVMTMSSGPNGQPQIYQASQSTRTGPGGVKETKKAVCDSRTGTKRLAIGRHIGERGHVHERVQNVQSGEQEETEDYINLEEDEAEDFNREWNVKSRDMPSHGRHALTYRDRQERRPRALPAITSGRSRVRPTTSVSRRLPALTYSSAEDDEIVVCERPKKRAREEEVECISEEEEDQEEQASPSTKKSSKKASRNA